MNSVHSDRVNPFFERIRSVQSATFSKDMSNRNEFMIKNPIIVGFEKISTGGGGFLVDFPPDFIARFFQNRNSPALVFSFPTENS